MTLIEYFLHTFERFRERIAYSYLTAGVWRDLTYNDVRLISYRLLNYLQREIFPSDRVILFAENSPFWCAAYIAIVMRGAIAVPVDAETPQEVLEDIINDSGAKLVLYSSKTSAIASSYRSFNIEEIELFPLSEEISFADVSEDTIASIIYTSGTTGTPKAVMLTHGNFAFEIEAGKKTGIIKDDENVLCLLPLHHTYPFVCSFLVPFCLGARVTFSPYLKGPEVIRIIKEKRITAVIAVPQMLELIRMRILEGFKRPPFFMRFFLLTLKNLSSFFRRKYDFNIGRFIFFFIHKKLGNQFRYFTSGGARLDPEVMKDLEAFGFTVIEGYGLTETSPVATFNPVNRRKPGSAGKPLEGVEIKIVNPDDSGVGEIAIKGGLVMKGYYKNEILTSEVLKDGWFLTGDLGFIDREGYLFITGRKKDVIVLSSGKTIYPEDVEERYKKKIPLIKEICLLENMEAVIVPDLEYAKNNGIVNIHASLRWDIEAVSRLLPTYMRIKGFVLHNEPLPKTRLGKFKRFLIKESISAKASKKRQRDSALQSDTGRRIVEILRELLPAVKYPHLSDHLELDLGMDSLRRLEFASAIEKRFSINITDAVLSRWHTLEDVINDIEVLKGSQMTIKGEIKTLKTGMIGGWFFRSLNLTILNIGYIFLKIVFKTFFLLRVKGIDALPPPPFIIVPNHTSYLDGFVLFASLPFRISRHLYFQGLKKYFPNKFIARLINVIPVSSQDEVLEAMTLSRDVLKKGYSLCIFPEGGRTFDGEIMEFKPGFAVLSIEAGVPVVPVIIQGTSQILPRGRLLPRWSRINLFFGRPLQPPSQLEEAQNFSAQIRELMIDLKRNLSTRAS